MSNNLIQTSEDGRKASPSRGSWWIVGVALIIGIGIGRGMSSGPAAIAADPTADATATRSAELAELNDMRTKVAQPVVCTPPPQPTATNTPEPSPTPTEVPAAPTGQEVTYGDEFAITVTSIVNVPTPDGAQGGGVYLRVDVTLKNLTNDSQPPPFADWSLVDANGNPYRVDSRATSEIVNRLWAKLLDKNETADRGIIFVVAADAGTSFVLESDTEPAFRVQLALESRG